MNDIKVTKQVFNRRKGQENPLYEPKETAHGQTQRCTWRTRANAKPLVVRKNNEYITISASTD